MRATHRTALATTAGITMVTAVIATAATAYAEPPLHHVRYTVTADAPFWAHIYYRDTDPPTWSDYSHNPYMFSPKAEADIGPGQPWVFDAMLAKPDLWAMVMVQSGEAPNMPPPGFNCELAVDGVIVKTDSGEKGALCSIRNWT
ncbi:hypothetical protein ACRCUN_24895 [Mycobacterium sp. LTG2003]